MKLLYKILIIGLICCSNITLAITTTVNCTPSVIPPTGSRCQMDGTKGWYSADSGWIAPNYNAKLSPAGIQFNKPGRFWYDRLGDSSMHYWDGVHEYKLYSERDGVFGGGGGTTIPGGADYGIQFNLNGIFSSTNRLTYRADTVRDSSVGFFTNRNYFTGIFSHTGGRAGFFGATPVTQQSGEVATGLNNLGIIILGSYDFSRIINKPTNIGAWGITDVFTKTETRDSIQDGIDYGQGNLDDTAHNLRLLIAGASGAVSSVFGRTGIVIAQNGDYNYSQISGAATAVSDTANERANNAQTNLDDTATVHLALIVGKQLQLNGTGFVKITGTTVTYDNTSYYPLSNPSNYISLSALSASAGVSYDNTTGVITLTNVGTAGTYGSASLIPVITINSKGQITATANTSILTNTLDLFAPPALDVGWNGNRITNLHDPLSPQDGSTKSYTDAVANGLSPKSAVRLATVAALPTNVYSNGTSGVGATLTESANGVLTVDGQAVNVGDRVLVKTEVATSHNGIYSCTTAGNVSVKYILTRTTDANTGANIYGSSVFVQDGTTNATAGFVNTNTTAPTIGTTGITFTQFTGAGEISAGTGIQITGNVVAIDNTVVTLTGSQAITNKTYNGNTFTSGSGILTIDNTYTCHVNGNTTISGTNTGDQTITLTSDVTGSGTGSFATTISAGAVTNAKIANATIDLTTKVTGILPVANGGTNVTTTTSINTTPVSYGLNTTITAAPSGSASGDLTGTYPGPTIASGAVTNSKIAAGTIDLTTKVTGALPLANGGTAATTATSINTTPLTYGANNTISIGVNSVVTTGVMTVSGTSTVTVGMPAATTSNGGYITSTDWNTFNGKGSGTVTSVGLVGSSTMSVTGTTSPITGAGVYTVSIPSSVPLPGSPTTTTPIFGDNSTKIPTTAFVATTYGPQSTSAANYTTSTTPTSSTGAVTTTVWFDVTAQAGALLFNAPTGTWADHQFLAIRIKDNGTARALTFNAIYRAGTSTLSPLLPTTTTISKNMYLLFTYNSADSKYDLLDVKDGY